MDSASDRAKSCCRLFLCGDVMLGRGIDQILPNPGDPVLHEDFVRSATTYVELAEQASGAIPRHTPFDYVWGDALAQLDVAEPDARIINLETSITTSRDFASRKGIHYKMNPANLPCLAAAKIDCCVLANNHVLDWGEAGLLETLASLDQAGIPHAGAGRDARQAAAPVILPLGGNGRVIVYSFGTASSGIPKSWASGAAKAGVNFLAELSEQASGKTAAQVAAERRPRDIAVASIHWGGNWGYGVPAAQRGFAHDLIDRGGFAVVHGHSSHHAKAIEVYRGRLILYGCGDFLTDYEGISGYEMYRSDLAVMYLPAFSLSEAKLEELRMIPFRVHRFRLERASMEDSEWLRANLEGESARFGAHVTLDSDATLALSWPHHAVAS